MAYMSQFVLFISYILRWQILFLYVTEEWYPQGKQNILPGQMTETLVTNLRPWTVYHLRVFAENQLGKSKDGKVLQVNCLTSWEKKRFFVLIFSKICDCIFFFSCFSVCHRW